MEELIFNIIFLLGTVDLILFLFSFLEVAIRFLARDNF